MNVKETTCVDTLLQGEELYQALGFSSYRSFYNHLDDLKANVPIFKIPRRKGWYAKAKDVNEYLDSF